MKYFSLVFLVLILGQSGFVFAQNNIPIYGWHSYLSYGSVSCITANGSKIIAGADVGMYVKDVNSGEYELYSKVSGMNDVQPKVLVYDPQSGMTLITYANSNIDVWTGDKFIALPYLKNLASSGDKQIYNAAINNGLAYLSTGQGIIVVRLDKQEIKESYSLSFSSVAAKVFDVCIRNNEIFAATNKGLYKATLSNPALQIFSSWTAVDTTREYRHLAVFKNNIYPSNDSAVYLLETDTVRRLYFAGINSIVKLSSTSNHLYVSEYYNRNNVYFARTILLNDQNDVVDSIRGGHPENVIELYNGAIYQADVWEGLKKIQDASIVERYAPPGPRTSVSFYSYAYNGDLWMAHGGYNIEKMESFFRFDGGSALKNGEWKIYDNSFFSSARQLDLSEIIKDPNDGTIYYSSFQDGLYSITPDGVGHINNDTSKLGVCIANGYPTIKTAGMAYDTEGNLWITCFGAQYELVCKTVDNRWYRYNVPLNRDRDYIYTAGRLIVDDNNLKWYLAPRNGGIIVYDDNGTIENPSDDRYKQLVQGKGFGNLPGSDALCLAKDKDGSIWIGTNNGIGIINCPSEVLNNQCEAEIRIVQYDQFAGYLFEGKAIRSIAVDGANRKWIGTAEGVWLLSPDGDKIIRRFTAENSPLPSNNVTHIGIDAITGLVYFSTDLGLISFRSDATEGNMDNANLLIFPNPVKSGFSGNISIKGLVADALVSITDISGKLVYKAQATGGQLVWNGKDYTGRRPQSGIYLVFVTNKDGSQKNVGKIAFLE